MNYRVFYTLLAEHRSNIFCYQSYITYCNLQFDDHQFRYFIRGPVYFNALSEFREGTFRQFFLQISVDV